MSKSNSRTYPAGERRERTSGRRQETEQSRLPQRTAQSVDVVDVGTPPDAADAHESTRAPVVVSSSTASAQSSQSSSASPPTAVDSSVTPLDRLGAAEARIHRLESELDRLRAERTVVDVDGRAKKRGENVSKRETRTRNRAESRIGSRKPLRDRNGDKNLLPKQQGGRFLPKKNDNLLRKLFWP
ncbi:hypothetical protein [Haloprofundus salinisoli]|uniref:hypothetical protein n=1 Tax=Haloprofundus salinisoli TaxID=2876193 RepID=UPI001CD02CCD|nr:hypothetical protein [Haloprofundus salinisoli]